MSTSLLDLQILGTPLKIAALFTCTHVHYTHILHTCCNWHGTSWASWYVHFLPLSSAGERPV